MRFFASTGILYVEGPLAQLVAHLHDAQGVRGSSPLRPTIEVFTCLDLTHLLRLVLSRRYDMLGR